MLQPGDLDADIERLDAYLMSGQSPEDCMMLCELDGFLTGLAVGSELIPPSEWQPIIWGGGEPAFDDADHARSITGAIMDRYAEIVAEIADGVIEPIYAEGPAGEIILSDWAEGFGEAIRLRSAAWEKLLASEKHRHLLLPIMALCSNEDGESLLGLSEETEKRFFDQAGEFVPDCVLEIAEFWRAARTAHQRQPTGPKIGRNDPCPCGSGKKYKRCCGAG